MADQQSTMSPEEFLRRLVAMDPWNDAYDPSECFFCRIVRHRIAGMKYSEQAHSPNCLWYQAKQAAAGRDTAPSFSLDPHDDVETTVAIARAAYGWEVGRDGRIYGLVAGDMGYAATHIVVNLSEVRPHPAVTCGGTGVVMLKADDEGGVITTECHGCTDCATKGHSQAVGADD